MTPKQLQAALDRYGPELAHWPQAKRAEAERLLERSEAARERFAQTQALWSALESSRQEPAAEPSARLKALVAQIPIEHPERAPAFWSPSWLWPPALGLAASLALGVWLGGRIEADPMAFQGAALQQESRQEPQQAAAEERPAPQTASAATASALAEEDWDSDGSWEESVDEDWEELSALAFGSTWLEL